MNNLCMLANNGNRLQMWNGASLSVAWYPSGKTEMIWLIGCVGNTPLPPLCCDYDIGLWSSITVSSHGPHGVTNHWQLDCLFNNLVRLKQNNQNYALPALLIPFDWTRFNRCVSWRAKSTQIDSLSNSLITKKTSKLHISGSFGREISAGQLLRLANVIVLFIISDVK